MKPVKGNSPKGTLHLDMFALLIELDNDVHVLTMANMSELKELRKEGGIVAEKRISFEHAECEYNYIALNAIKAGNAKYICADSNSKISVAFDGNVELVKELLD